MKNLFATVCLSITVALVLSAPVSADNLTGTYWDSTRQTTHHTHSVRTRKHRHTHKHTNEDRVLVERALPGCRARHISGPSGSAGFSYYSIVLNSKHIVVLVSDEYDNGGGKTGRRVVHVAGQVIDTKPSFAYADRWLDNHTKTVQISGKYVIWTPEHGDWTLCQTTSSFRVVEMFMDCLMRVGCPYLVTEEMGSQEYTLGEWRGGGTS